ncbi:TerC family protein [Paucibacter sp. XJ19-41]|uniref:TerC family protein n=1 Tax=Paucibacter sp. XJ19-41 TaxID=2927824 RepID=UPI00234B9CA6|nr:TerC family protein [Paucibacter sp. XJ19-41]MDC6168205.1 TerC family protein [Paucibacter sp. XJ19-41]
MDFLLDPNIWIAFAMLTALEIVLGIDNIIFISILVGRLPPHMRDKARRLGLGFAMVSRLALLFTLSWVMGLTADLFTVLGQGISGRDLVLLFGGLFLLYKASHEIFVEVEAHEQDGPPVTETAEMKAAGQRLFWAIIGQIAIIDIVFSLDSVITAVGMVDQIGVMVAAVVTSVGVMLVAAKPIGDFVDRHPSVKVLALAFLVMVGMALTAEAFDQEIPKGYIYAAMCFSLAVEALNIRARSKRQALAKSESVSHSHSKELS